MKRKIIIVIVFIIMLLGCNKEEEEYITPISKTINNEEIIKNMGKIQNTYGGFTATALKTRASIPTQTNIIVNGSSIDCSNIIISGIKGVLGDTATSVVNLSNSANVNKWSGFSPIEYYNVAAIQMMYGYLLPKSNRQILIFQ